LNLRRNAQLLLIIIGLVIAGYLTYAHYAGTQLACPNIGVLNCEGVTTSQYSAILGVPVALLGLALFLLAVLMILGRNETLIFLWSLAAGLAVLYSIGSMVLLGEVCLYCGALDVTMILTILVSNVGIGKKTARC
jgi:uncharacterized membrane protein